MAFANVHRIEQTKFRKIGHIEYWLFKTKIREPHSDMMTVVVWPSLKVSFERYCGIWAVHLTLTFWRTKYKLNLFSNKNYKVPTK